MRGSSAIFFGVVLVSIALTALIGCGGGDSDGSGNGNGNGNGGGQDAGDGTRPTVFGGDRPVEIIVPDSYDHATPTPLLFVLHGLGANGTVQAAYTGFNTLPNQRNVIVLAPEGTELTDGRQFWNGTDACCDFEGSNVDDSGYLKGLVTEISAEWNIDANRVFLFGHSNGGFMSYRLACDHADTFAALGSLAGASFLNVADCTPSQPVGVLQIHGDADATVPYAGSIATPSARASSDNWASYNGCSGPVATGPADIDIDASLAGAETIVETAPGCPASGSAELWTIQGGSHIPSLTDNFHTLVYDWFETQARN